MGFRERISALMDDFKTETGKDCLEDWYGFEEWLRAQGHEVRESDGFTTLKREDTP